MKKIQLSVFLIFTLIFSGYGQFDINIGMNSYYDDNLFRTPIAEEDMFTGFSFGLGYTFPETNLTLNYAPDFYTFNSNSIRNFMQHTMGFDYYTSYFSNQAYLFAGAEYRLRNNRSEYDYYNYSQFSGYINSRFSLGLFFLRAGYNYRFRDYPNFPDISNSRHQFFLQFNRSLPTKTTIIVELGYGNKRFSEYESVQTILNTYERTGGIGGQGKGKMGSVTDTFYTEMSDKISPPNLNQASYLIRISQSIHRNIGIFGQYRRQLSITNDTQYQNVNTYLQDEELFDDPFSYESHSAESRLTWLLPWSTKLMAGYEWQSKSYVSEQAYISAEDTAAVGGIREDTYREAYLTLIKTFHFERGWLESLEIPIRIYATRNRSNSYWYTYENMILSTGIQISFNSEK